MILKKLTAIGFKSFADKMELDFGTGITCIVGPNGCGKSNVVDSIKWVLGEQSAKSLRGKQMMDVIFNGSGTRKSAGMVQVDLTFDNADGTLPSDQPEVVVSRRLYRSGESEYLLNRQSCRLRDVRELFLDTGIGVDAYSVIEQGKVDVLLQANPAERRVIFEEAAGINKYKVRKKEALRRLERVDQNLLRLQDIVDEVEKRLRSVKVAAGKARNYQTYTQRLRELRSTYAMAEYHRLHTGGDELDREIAGLSDQSTAARTELSNVEARSSEANIRTVELEREISLAENRLLTVQSQITANQERTTAAKKRIEDQESLLGKSRERLAAFDQQMASLDGRLDEQSRQAASVEQELTAIHGDLSTLQEREREILQRTHDTRVRLDDEKAGTLDLIRRTSQIRNDIQTLVMQQETLTGQKDKLDARDAALSSELSDLVQRQDGLRARFTEVESLIGQQTQRLEETRGQIAAIAEHRSRLLDQLAAAKEYRSGLESRRQLLEEMDRRHEGLIAGVREILERRDAARAAPAVSAEGVESVGPQDGGRYVGDEAAHTAGGGAGRYEYVVGAVGELFEADLAHASLVEAVLGSHEQYLVVTEREKLLAERDQFTDAKGRILAFCLDATPPAIGAPDLSGHEGFVAKLLDWVRFPPDCERLARHLLGRAYVVETVDDARRLAEVVGPIAARFVTLDGIVWDSDGRVGMGSLGYGSGLISRRSELRELSRSLSEVEDRIVALSADLERTQSEAVHLESLQTDLRNAIYQATTSRAEVQAQLSSLETTLNRLSEERPLIASEIAVLVRRLEEARGKEEAGKDQLTQLEHRSAEGERIVAELEAALIDFGRQRDGIVEQTTTARVRAGELSQRRASLAETVRQLQAARIQLQADRDKADRDVVEAQERIDQSRRQIEEAAAALASLTAEAEELTGGTRNWRQERDDLRAAIDQYANDVRRLRHEIDQIEARLHERQIKLQEIRVRTEDLVARVREELSVDLAEQYAQGYTPDEHQDWAAIESEIEDLRGKIERLGNVNLDSLTEQQELETRQQFLASQLKDLRDSEQQLKTLIETLNDESRQRFLDTFNAVSVQFTALFKKLFGGGKAELTLMDPNDVLECGIEVMARPPGKEPQSISLLSGGEKTMTALALLLAVFRSRPSPFVLMDEVDAALDEANNVRFNHVIQEFAQISQFIVITHSKRTMSIADVMYGITMQEAGVSKKVSVKFEDDRQGQPAVA